MCVTRQTCALEDISRTTSLVKVVECLGPDASMHFSAFHPDRKMWDIRPMPVSTLSVARNIAIKNNVNYAYIGNVHDSRGGNT